MNTSSTQFDLQEEVLDPESIFYQFNFFEIGIIPNSFVYGQTQLLKFARYYNTPLDQARQIFHSAHDLYGRYKNLLHLENKSTESDALIQWKCDYINAHGALMVELRQGSSMELQRHRNGSIVFKSGVCNTYHVRALRLVHLINFLVSQETDISGLNIMLINESEVDKFYLKYATVEVLDLYFANVTLLFNEAMNQVNQSTGKLLTSG